MRRSPRRRPASRYLELALRQVRAMTSLADVADAELTAFVDSWASPPVA